MRALRQSRQPLTLPWYDFQTIGIEGKLPDQANREGHLFGGKRHFSWGQVESSKQHLRGFRKNVVEKKLPAHGICCKKQKNVRSNKTSSYYVPGAVVSLSCQRKCIVRNTKPFKRYWRFSCGRRVKQYQITWPNPISGPSTNMTAVAQISTYYHLSGFVWPECLDVSCIHVLVTTPWATRSDLHKLPFFGSSEVDL